MSTLAFTLSDMLLFIILSLLVGAFFGGWIARESKRLWKRPTMGQLIGEMAHLRGIQVIRSMGLSKARLEGNETEGRLREYDPTAEPSNDAETHSEN